MSDEKSQTFDSHIPQRLEEISKAYQLYAAPSDDKEDNSPKVIDANSNIQELIFYFEKQFHKRLSIKFHIVDADDEKSVGVIIRDARNVKTELDFDLNYAYEHYMVQALVNYQAALDILSFYYHIVDTNALQAFNPFNLDQLFKKHHNRKSICEIYEAYNLVLIDALHNVTGKKTSKLKSQLEKARFFATLQHKDYDVCTISQYKDSKDEETTFFNAHIAFGKPNKALLKEYDTIKPHGEKQKGEESQLPDWYRKLSDFNQWLVQENIKYLRDGSIVPTQLVDKIIHAPPRNCFIMASGTISNGNNFKSEHYRSHSGAIAKNHPDLAENNQQIISSFYVEKEVNFQTLVSPGSPIGREDDRSIILRVSETCENHGDYHSNYPMYERHFPIIGNQAFILREKADNNIALIRHHADTNRRNNIKKFLDRDLNQKFKRENFETLRTEFKDAFDQIANTQDNALKKLYMAAITYKAVRINRTYFEQNFNLNFSDDIYERVPIPSALESTIITAEDQPVHCNGGNNNYNLFEAALEGIMDDHMRAIEDKHNSITHSMCKSGKDRTWLVLAIDRLFTTYATLNNSECLPIYTGTGKTEFESRTRKFLKLFEQQNSECEGQYMATYQGSTRGCFGVLPMAQAAYPNNLSKNAAKQLFLNPAKFRKHIFKSNTTTIVVVIVVVTTLLALAVDLTIMFGPASIPLVGSIAFSTGKMIAIVNGATATLGIAHAAIGFWKTRKNKSEINQTIQTGNNLAETSPETYTNNGACLAVTQ